MRGGASLSMRTALAGTTGNAMLMGVAEVSTPLGWVLLPGLLGVSTRPRVAALVSAWAGVLVLASVVVPVVPGHRGDPSALLASAACLAAAPLLAWARRRPAKVVRAAAAPDVAVFAMPAGPGRAALAICGTPGEIAAAVPVRDGGLRVLLGAVTGATLAAPASRRAIEQAFREHAGRSRSSLPQLVAALEQVVRDLAPAGHLRATIVRVDSSGAVEAVRCGAPDLIVTDGGRAEPAGVPAGPAIGASGPAGPATPVRVPAGRVAVVGAGFTEAHGDRWVHALEPAGDGDPAGAAQLLTAGPRGGRRVGPAFVVDPGPPARH
ncbi:SpoIIE family protein phosphatase [Micromonospora sp. DT31]|uniref:SpoIIE family protein phosphatase n=1 Tax=Micromonospora sp. DT31 TaxID=3393434 RepID=UPI003CE6A40C